jgi:predicted SpoU family rRNA methylase
MNKTAKKTIEAVITAYGGVKAVQERFNYGSPMAVYNWRARGIPRHLLLDIFLDTGIDPHALQKAGAE